MGKEEDKIERLIRGLIKLPENKRCINCNSLGPQYVCTTFWTFVCTNCSGVHREFTHRVKSVSMAKFSMEEVNCLQAGGNEKAREIYFKTWNPHRNFFPDNSNIQKLRDFIKHVYVDRRYTGENHPVLLPRLRNNDKDESYERSRQDTFRERAIDRQSRYAIDEVRSPKLSRETNERYNRYSNNEPRSPARYGGVRASSARFEATEGRYQVDDARIAGRSATQMFTTEDIKPRRKSPPPPVRNVREFLDEKFLALRVGDQPKRPVHATTNTRVGDYGGQNSPREMGDHSKTAHKRSVSAYLQNTVQTGNQVSGSNDTLKPKSGSAGSLIDFALFPPPPPPPDSCIQVQVPSVRNNATSSEPTVKESENVSTGPPKNTLEFLLFELSTPAEITPNENVASSVPSSNSSTLHHVPPHSSHTNAQEFPNTPSTSAAGMQIFRPVEEAHAETPQMVPDFLGDDSVSSFDKTDNQQDLISQQQESSIAPQTSLSGENSNNQCQQETDLLPASIAKSSNPVEGPLQETNSGVGVTPSSGDAKSSGRAALPEDLFASPYPSRAMSAPGWQMNQSYGIGFNMPYYQNASPMVCCLSVYFE
ncbi:hypothetical protein RND81_03G126300 [Saponaria officinalis]|uniref:Arf-GAP domain-containing protein n=1 Tax=Saponaria officinalis TaxID=3572 RepID=A0AAW1M7B4_SAPOF